MLKYAGADQRILEGGGGTHVPHASAKGVENEKVFLCVEGAWANNENQSAK